MATLITGLPEHATLGSTPLSAGASPDEFAWMAIDLGDVRRPATLRGTDTIKPTVHGVTPNRRYRTSSFRLIPLVFAGDCDPDGAAAAYPYADQVWVNLDAFTVAVMDPDSTPTRLLTVTDGDLEWTGDVIVEDFDYQQRDDGDIAAVLEVSIPDGRLYLNEGS